MSNTSAYGWNIPDNTDLVKDGALAIRTLGNAIDTSMNTALGTRKAGMVLLNTTSFSGVAAQNFSGVFSNTYKFYKVNLQIACAVGGSDVLMRFREGATDKATSYYSSSYASTAANTSGIFGAVNNGTYIYLGTAFTDPDANMISMDILRTASKGTLVSRCMESTNSRQFSTGGINTSMSAFDGFTIYPSTNNISGTAYIYGYNQ